MYRGNLYVLPTDSLILTLVVFLFAQRRLVEGLTLGSVKG